MSLQDKGTSTPKTVPVKQMSLQDKGTSSPKAAPVKQENPRPFRARVFLLRMLAFIFVAELATLLFAFQKCTKMYVQGPEVNQTILERCPSIGSRSQELFAVAIATTLSLLGSSPEAPSP